MVSLRALAGLVKALIYCAAVPSAFTPPEKPTAGADLGAPSLGVRTRTSAGQGALVERVFRQGPADRAGVRPGDVITDLGGSSIRSDPQYNSALAHATVGVPLTLKVSRGGQTETLTVVAERAIPLYTRLCDASDLDACGTIGYMLSNGVRVPRDPARGELLLQKACDGGNLPACVNLGSLLEDELPSGPEPARAARPYEKACTGGVMAGCVNLGRLLRSGRGVPPGRRPGHRALPSRLRCGRCRHLSCPRPELLERQRCSGRPRACSVSAGTGLRAGKRTRLHRPWWPSVASARPLWARPRAKPAYCSSSGRS